MQQIHNKNNQQLCVGRATTTAKNTQLEKIEMNISKI